MQLRKRSHARGVLCIAGLILLPAARAEAEVGLELEANLLGSQALMYNGVGQAVMAGGIGGGTLLGIPVGRRIVLQAGLQVSGGSSESNGARSEAYSLVVPLRLKAYLREPGAGKVVPLLRLGVAYDRGSGSYGGEGDFVSHAIEGAGAFGVTYFVTERLGVGMDAGVTYSRWFATTEYDASSGWNINASWQMSVVLRI